MKKKNIFPKSVIICLSISILVAPSCFNIKGIKKQNSEIKISKERAVDISRIYLNSSTDPKTRQTAELLDLSKPCDIFWLTADPQKNKFSVPYYHICFRYKGVGFLTIRDHYVIVDSISGEVLESSDEYHK